MDIQMCFALRDNYAGEIDKKPPELQVGALGKMVSLMENETTRTCLSYYGPSTISPGEILNPTRAGLRAVSYRKRSVILGTEVSLLVKQ